MACLPSFWGTISSISKLNTYQLPFVTDSMMKKLVGDLRQLWLTASRFFNYVMIAPNSNTLWQCYAIDWRTYQLLTLLNFQVHHYNLTNLSQLIELPLHNTSSKSYSLFPDSLISNKGERIKIYVIFEQMWWKSSPIPCLYRIISRMLPMSFRSSMKICQKPPIQRSTPIHSYHLSITDQDFLPVFSVLCVSSRETWEAAQTWSWDSWHYIMFNITGITHTPIIVWFVGSIKHYVYVYFKRQGLSKSEVTIRVASRQMWYSIIDGAH